MKRQTGLLLASALLLMAQPSPGNGLPKFEWHTNGCFYDLSNVFTSSNNQPGQVVTLPEKSGWIGVNATCPAGTTVITPIEAMSLNFRFKAPRAVFST